MMKTFIFCMQLFFVTFAVAGQGGNSPPAPTPWVDPVLEPKISLIKAVHINQLRTLVNANRLICLLPPTAWTNDPIVSKATPIKKNHIDELRTSVSELANSFNVAVPSEHTYPDYADPQIVAKSTIIRASHMSQLRSYASAARCPSATGSCNCYWNQSINQNWDPVGQYFNMPDGASFNCNSNGSTSMCYCNTSNGYFTTLVSVGFNRTYTCHAPSGPINGLCGTANGSTVPTIPTTNLCAAGTASAVGGTGPWTWTCAGSGGGTTANCSAAATAGGPGLCGTSDGVPKATAPTNLCAAGSPVTVPGSTWSWSCIGTTTAFCTAPYSGTWQQNKVLGNGDWACNISGLYPTQAACVPSCPTCVCMATGLNCTAPAGPDPTW